MTAFIARREFITLLGGAAVWPASARAQQSGRVRRMGVLMSFAESDSEARFWLNTFLKRLTEIGWTEGSTAHIEVRWAITEEGRMQASKELLELNPEVIVACGTPAASL